MTEIEGVEVEVVDTGVYPTVIIRVPAGYDHEVEPFWQLEQSEGGPVKLTFTLREAGDFEAPPFLRG